MHLERRRGTSLAWLYHTTHWGVSGRGRPRRKGLPMRSDLVWSAALGELQLQMTQATFDTWLRDSRFLGFEDDTFTIGLKSEYAKDWLEHRLLTTIKRTMTRLTGRTIEVKFVVYEEQDRREAHVLTIDEVSSTDSTAKSTSNTSRWSKPCRNPGPRP